jgi:hypothetical protein
VGSNASEVDVPLTPEERRKIYEAEEVRLEAEREIKAEEKARLKAESQPVFQKAILGCLGCLGLVFLIVLIASISSQLSKTAPRSGPPQVSEMQPGVHDDLSLFIAKYGPPDRQDGTEYDVPRPPIVTHWIIYDAERVQAIYYPDEAPVGSPPPYSHWKLMGFTDPVTNEAVSPETVVARMGHRGR